MYGPGVPDLTNDEIDQLQRLEEGMWLTSTRSDREWMERHLAPDFHEVGRSGRRWTRGEILAMPIGEIESTMPLPEFLGPPSGRRSRFGDLPQCCRWQLVLS